MRTSNPEITGLVAGRFEFQERIGSGGFGDVYRGYDKLRESVVAIKVLHENDPKALRRFKKEFRELSGITHPNLVQLYEFFSADQMWFFTMKIVPGWRFLEYLCDPLPTSTTSYYSFSQYEEFNFNSFPEVPQTQEVETLAEDHHVDFFRLNQVCKQLVSGVHHLHRNGKLHCDLKPENVLIDDQDNVVILDFGMVSGLNGSEREFAGTPHFMAPEQARGSAPSFSSDWYAVGVMLFLAMTGRYPIDGRSPVQILMKKRTAKAPTKDDFPPTSPMDLVAICIDLLNPDPDQRPQGEDLLTRLGSDNLGLQWRVASTALERESTPFIGRGPEFVKMETVLVDALGKNELTIYNVKGTSGIGKTALVRSFLEKMSKAYDISVFHGRCNENETLAFKAFDALVDEITDHIIREKIRDNKLFNEDGMLLRKLFPVLGQLKSIGNFTDQDVKIGQEASRALSAFAHFLTKLARLQPVVLFIDDVQWADLDSAKLLRTLKREIQAPILLITTDGGEERTNSFFSKIPNAAIDALIVPPLTLQESRTLAASIAVDSHENAELIAREAEGNPMFIDTYARFSKNPVNGQRADFSMLLQSRISSLPKDARDYLRTIAVSGQPISRENVRSITRIRNDEQAIVSQLRNVRLIRLIVVDGVRCLELYHKRIRENVLGELSPNEIVAQNLALAEILSENTTQYDRIARHYLAAEQPTRAANFYLLASKNFLEGFAYEASLESMELALEAGDWGNEDELKLGIQQGNILASMGRGSAAAEQYLYCSQFAMGLESIDLRRRAFEQLLRSGHSERGIAILRDIMAELDFKVSSFSQSFNFAILKLYLTRPKTPSLPKEQSDFDALRIETVWTAANILSVIDVKLGLYFQLLNHHLSLKLGTPTQVARTLALSAVHDAVEAKTRKNAAEQLRLANDILRKDKDADNYDFDWQEFALGLTAYMASEFTEANRIFKHVSNSMSVSAFPWEREIVYIYQTYCLLMTAEFKQYRSLYPKLVDSPIQRDDKLQARSAIIWRYIVHLADDQPEKALQELQEIEASWKGMERYHVQQFWHLQGMINTYLYQGEPQKAHLLLNRSWKQSVKGFILRTQLGRIIAIDLKIRISLALCIQTKQKPKVEKFIKKLNKENLPYAKVLANLHLAQLAIFNEDTQRAAQLFAEAESLASQEGLALFSIIARIGGSKLLQSDEEVVQRNYESLRKKGLKTPEKFIQIYLPIQRR